MIAQRVKYIKNGNVLITTVWCANDMVKRGTGYLIGEPFEFPEKVVEVIPEPVEVEDSDSE